MAKHCCLFAILLASAALAVRQVHVDAIHGSDGNDGMSAETALRSKHTTKSDIWALGVALDATGLLS